MRSCVLNAATRRRSTPWLPALFFALVGTLHHCQALAGDAAVALQAGSVTAAEASAGRHLLADSCAAQGLDGSCMGKCCCCYAGGAGIVSYEPDDTCACKRVVNTSQVVATVVLSIVLVLGGLLCQLYFGGSLCGISPYPDQQRRRHGGRVSPAEQPAYE